MRNSAKVLTALKMKKLALYGPYPKQRAFHDLGSTKRERALLAGNQLGKTWSAGNEMAYHLTGEYPEWWKGRRFVKPIQACASNTNNETVRDNPQRILLGKNGEWGTGTVPRSAVAKKPTMSRGFPDLVDVVQVKHKSGGISTCQFKAYDQGRKSFQGYTWDAIWCDEEPPADVYAEILARITATGGIIFLTMTPLLGMSEVVSMFYPEPNTPYRGLVQMDIEDAGHFDSEERDMVVASYPSHEREARSRGLPLLGSGLVFQIPHSTIEVEPFDIPNFWPTIIGCDFGYGDHPFAAVKVAFDRDSDRYYVTNEYREKTPSPAIHASSLRPWGEDTPVAWPHDGNRDWGEAGPIAQIYRKEGLRMLRKHATFAEGGYSTEAAIQVALSRMQTGRLKVFSTCTQLFSELSTYHRKKGQIVKQYDDLISSLYKAIMMIRFARVPDSTRKFVPQVESEFDPFDWREA